MKYKISGPGFIKIDDAGNKSAIFRKEDKPGTMGANLYLEMINSGIEIEPEFTAEELAQQQAEQDAADAIAWIGERKAEYQKEGCTEEALIVALWEKIVEGRPEAADALQVKRQAVKDKIKKPNLE